MISRVNSALNQTDHAARDGEASRIATLVAGTIVGKPEFRKIHTIRVQYVGRIKTGGHEKIIDTVDFRRDSKRSVSFSCDLVFSCQIIQYLGSIVLQEGHLNGEIMDAGMGGNDSCTTSS